MIITLLGTNGWFDSVTGQTLCTLIQTETRNIILDAGFGYHKTKNLMDFSKPTELFLSHLHLDHTIGLHCMDYFDYQLPLKIFMPSGQKDALKVLLSPPYTSDISRASYPVEFYSTDEIEKAALPYPVISLPLTHTVPDVGYRFEIEGKTITYLCDTGYCENAVTLSKNADLVITECGSLPGKAKPGWPHMDPQLAARLGVASNAKKVLLIHFGAGDFDTIEKRLNAVAIGREIYPGLICGVDNLQLCL